MSTNNLAYLGNVLENMRLITKDEARSILFGVVCAYCGQDQSGNHCAHCGAPYLEPAPVAELTYADPLVMLSYPDLAHMEIKFCFRFPNTAEEVHIHLDHPDDFRNPELILSLLAKELGRPLAVVRRWRDTGYPEN